jgi:hypothetical protein
MPRSTEQHINNRVAALREEATARRRDDLFWESLGA